MGVRIEARHVINPAVVLARIAVDAGGEVLENGRREAWDFLPTLVALPPIGDTVLSLFYRNSDAARSQLIHLPPATAFARYTTEYGLSVTALPDSRHVVVQSAHGGGTFAV